MPILSNWSNVHLRILSPYCLDNLSISDSGTFRFPTVIMFWSVSLSTIRSDHVTQLWLKRYTDESKIDKEGTGLDTQAKVM